MDPSGHFSFWFRYLLSSLRARGLAAFAAPEGLTTPDSMSWQEVAEYQVAWGSPVTVVDKLVALRDLTGPFGVLTAMAQEWDDPAFCRRSMTLLAEDVMPKFAKHADIGTIASARASLAIAEQDPVPLGLLSQAADLAHNHLASIPASLSPRAPLEELGDPTEERTSLERRWARRQLRVEDRRCPGQRLPP